MRIGALEAGGTKMVVAVFDGENRCLRKASIPTSRPEETLPKMISFFQEEKLDALGIASFGPVDLHPESKTYGWITTTPKKAWRNVDLVGAFQKALKVPIGFDTDVNGALLGEVSFGSCKGLSDAVYLTVGTGIGGGVLSGGKLLHGMLHPEIGHLRVPRVEGDDYAGCCPYHKDCLEGMASGPAIEGRYGRKAQELASVPEVWDLESRYLAYGIVDLILTLSPQRIVLGGGVLHQEQLYPLIRKHVEELLGGYLSTPEVQDLSSYLVAPALRDEQGILGAMMLGKQKLTEKEKS